MSKKIVIIGGVATGPKTASRARRHDPEVEITIIERGDVYSYAGCGMPFYIEGVIEDINELLCTTQGVLRDEKYFKKVKNIKIFGMTEALQINREDKTVTVKELKTEQVYEIPYNKLVIATGASPIIPRIEGIDLSGVHNLSNPMEAEAIRSQVEREVKNVAIVGGGLIGMEICGAFVSRGCKVTLFEMLDQILPALLDEDMALLLENYLMDQGIHIQTKSQVKRLLDDGSGSVSIVLTSNGKEIDTDLVLLAIGVRPNVELASDAKLKIGETGAIAVNEHLQTNDPEIYAGGDCVENTCLITGGKIYCPLGSTANKHGRVIGDNVTGCNSTFPGITRTTVFKVLDYNVGKTGLNEREANEAGFKIVTSIAPKSDCSHYYPSNKPLTIKLIADEKTGKLLGGQILGPGDVVKRIDVLATAIKFGASVEDVANLDLGYAPPYSTAIDPVAHAANIIRNKREGLARSISQSGLKDKLDKLESFVLLDVRAPLEAEKKTFQDNRVKIIPLDELRDRLSELPKEGEIIIFCRTGVRAYEAQRILDGSGFTDVKFLDGCLSAWPYSL